MKYRYWYCYLKSFYIACYFNDKIYDNHLKNDSIYTLPFHFAKDYTSEIKLKSAVPYGYKQDVSMAC